METLRRKIEQYIPKCEQEEYDKALMLEYMTKNDDVLLRSNTAAHFSASAWVVNKDRSRVLMVYHNIYDSWSWTGGHADGESDLLSVAVREVKEETGITLAVPVFEDIFSLEVLTVDGHIKNGRYVSSHLHLNVSYLIEADEQEVLHIKPDENKGVRWFSLDEAMEAVSEKWMKKWIYKKLINRIK
ncbi:MAG: NUDIX hydrolase [Candidatus Metalachnospira sp.]|nr:NUDIX hydrolase [Candidatus Metalachnospira sp.]